MGCKGPLDARLAALKALDVLYQIMLSKTPKNVIFQKWVAQFFYPKI